MRQATTKLLYVVVRELASHDTRLPGPNVAGFMGRATLQMLITFVIVLPGPLMVEQCVQRWTERESFLRSGEYNALAGSPVKPVCFS